MPFPVRSALLVGAASLLMLPLAGGADPTPAAAVSAAPHAPADGPPLLWDAIASLPLATEDRRGYKRTSFKHWVDADHDGCTTRDEVLLEEAVVKPEIGPDCDLVGGSWHSYYDDVDVTDAGGLDVDHLVPLAEAWDSGADEWTGKKREEYANFLDDPWHLVAVTARSNRQKADKDPAAWLPPHVPARCRYVAEWTAVKLRWALSVDQAEKKALAAVAQGCPNTELPGAGS